jgi:hypothetical protein
MGTGTSPQRNSDTEVRTLEFRVEIDTYASKKHDGEKLRVLCQALHYQFPTWRVYDSEGNRVTYEALAHGGRGEAKISTPPGPRRRWWSSRD